MPNAWGVIALTHGSIMQSAIGTSLSMKKCSVLPDTLVSRVTRRAFHDCQSVNRNGNTGDFYVLHCN